MFQAGMLMPNFLKGALVLLVILPTAFGQMALTTAQIAKKVSPSVVVIRGKTDAGDVLGSGFIVSKDGKLVTNLHVIRDMKAASVQLANGETFDTIGVLAIDERRDIAIVQISGFNLPVLMLGNSNEAIVGEHVVVVGSPHGLVGTVTAGILSSIRDSGDGFKVLQTDAALNPGNSGGPLLNGKGQVIGVIVSQLESSVGLNFAIPINYVRGILANLHGPITFDQMRNTLTQASALSLESDTSRLSLNATLDWLKRVLPLGSMHKAALGKEVIITLVPIRFDSCTASFDLAEEWVWGTDDRRLMVTRFSVSLGALTDGNVKRVHDQGFDQFVVTLETAPNGTVTEYIEDSENPTKSTGKISVIPFAEEAMAGRVLNAFIHAGDLCRNKQP
jgi:S1-C subfamily serine protease